MGARTSKRPRPRPVASQPDGGEGGDQPASPPSGLWEWADDSHVYRAYDAAATATLEEAFVAGQSSVALTLGAQTYTIDLVGLQQTNDVTHFSRVIRRNAAFASTSTPTPPLPSSRSSSRDSLASTSSSPPSLSSSQQQQQPTADGPAWEFEKEGASSTGEWEPYDRLTTRLLEGSLVNGRINVVLNHGAFAVPGGYLVDFVGLTQTKQATQETTRVRRVPPIDPSQHAAIAKALSAAAASTSSSSSSSDGDGKNRHRHGGDNDNGAEPSASSSSSASPSGFMEVGKARLKEVAKLTRWARVTDKLIPEETCPVCLCEFLPDEDPQPAAPAPAPQDDKEHEEEEQQQEQQQPHDDEKDEKDKKKKEKEKDKKKKNKNKEKKEKVEKKRPNKEKPIEDEPDDVVVRLSQCQGHYFHRDCIVHCFKSGYLQCPICNVVYGVRIGTMPEGTMSVSTYGPSLSGFEDCGTIQIDYHFPSGVQGPEHPHPGVGYGGTSRTAYLPDNKEGQEILTLFKIAWERKLLFTVGRSVTTGEDNQVVWGGVHQKTSTSGGPTNFGYPDPTYFDRVKAELSAKGVLPDA